MRDISLTKCFDKLTEQKGNLSKLYIGSGKIGKKPRWKPTCKQASVVKHRQPVHWQNSEDLPLLGGITLPLLVLRLVTLLMVVLSGWLFLGVEW